MDRSPTSSNAALRNALKSQTAAAHRRLDATMSGWGAFDSVDGYTRYLIGMRRLHAHFAEAVAMVAAESSLDDNTRRILAALEEDINHHHDDYPRGINQEAVAGSVVSDIPLDTTAGPVNHWRGDAASAWGIAYVLEGSALGSKYVRRAVVDALTDKASTAYLTLMNQNARSRWPVFVDQLEVLGSKKQPVVDAAKEAFAVAESIFSLTEGRARMSSTNGFGL